MCHWWERVTNECTYCLQYARTYVPAYSAVSMYFTRCEYKLCVEGIRGGIWQGWTPVEEPSKCVQHSDTLAVASPLVPSVQCP